MKTAGNRVPPDCAALLLAGLLVAYGARRDGTDRARVKVTDALDHSVGLSISPAMAATIFRRDLLAPAERKARLRHMSDLVLGYLRK